MKGREAIEAFLRGIKVDVKKIKPLLDQVDEDVDFDPDIAADDYLTTRSTVTEADIAKKVSDAIDEDRKDRRDKIRKEVTEPLKLRLKRDLGLEIEDVKNAELDTVIQAAIKKMTDQGSYTDQSLKQKYDDITAKYNQALDAIDAEKATIEKLEKDKEQAIKDIRAEIAADSKINQKLSAVKWAVDGNRLTREHQIIANEAKAKFKITEDGTITNKDGSPAMKPDGTSRFKTVDDYIDWYVDEYSLRKVSNGEDDMRVTGKSAEFLAKAKDKDKAIETVKKVNERIKERAKELGIPESEIPVRR